MKKSVELPNSDWVEAVVIVDATTGMPISVGSAVMPALPFASGTLANGVPVVVPMAGAPMQCTITLKSAAAGRFIELSTDGGVEYFVPTYDVNTTTMLVVVVASTLTHVRITGAATHTWRIQ